MKTRKPVRLQGYDYSREGVYFVTICSKDRECIFGHPGVGAPLACVLTLGIDARTIEIELTQIGQIIEKKWNDIPNQFKTVDIDEFVIMPNHIHGILIINKRAEASAAPTLSLIIRSFKSKCTMEYLRHINENNLNASAKIWQRSFHDHIIRNDESLEKIRNYIRNNPSTWNEDKNNLSYNNQLQPTAKRGS
jgi:REP element-mobilizing transposase RayT